MGLEVLSICSLNLGFNRARADHLVWLCPRQYTWSWEKLTMICVMKQDHKRGRSQSPKIKGTGDLEDCTSPVFIYRQLSDDWNEILVLKKDLVKCFRWGWDDEIHGMRARQKKKIKGNSAEAERRNAQKLLKSCQSHSWGFGIGKDISKKHPFHLPIWKGADCSSPCVGKVCRREM